MNIALLEDCAQDAKEIESFVRVYCQKNCFDYHLETFATGEVFLEAFASGGFSLALLDVYLPGMSGVETAKKLRETDPAIPVIFVTVSMEHALDAYGVFAAAYLVKPLTQAKMDRALDMCASAFQKSGRVIEIMSERAGIKLPVHAIRYVEVYGKAVLFHMGAKTVKTYMPLAEIEKLLGGAPFLRCHRSFFVNLNYVADVREDELLLTGSTTIPLRRSGRADLKMDISKFMMDTPFYEEA